MTASPFLSHSSGGQVKLTEMLSVETSGDPYHHNYASTQHSIIAPHESEEIRQKASATAYSNQIETWAKTQEAFNKIEKQLAWTQGQKGEWAKLSLAKLLKKRNGEKEEKEDESQHKKGMFPSAKKLEKFRSLSRAKMDKSQQNFISRMRTIRLSRAKTPEQDMRPTEPSHLSPKKRLSIKEESIEGVVARFFSPENKVMPKVTPEDPKRVLSTQVDYDAFPQWFQERVGISYFYSKKKYAAGETVAQLIAMEPKSRTGEQRERVLQWLRAIPHFENLPSSISRSLSERMTTRIVKANTTLFLEGLELTSSIIIFQGTILGTQQSTTNAKLYKQGDLIGKQALVEQYFIPETLVTKSDCTLVYINKLDYQAAVNDFLHWNRSTIMDFIATTSLFNTLGWQKLEVLSSFVKCRFFLKGEVIYDIGDVSEFIAIVYKGKLMRSIPKNMERQNRWPISSKSWKVTKINWVTETTANILPGEIFGDYDFFFEIPRQEKVVVVEPSCLLYIDRSKFYELLIKEDTDKYMIAKGWIRDQELAFAPEKEKHTDLHEEKVESTKILLEVLRSRMKPDFMTKQNPTLQTIKDHLNRRLAHLHKNAPIYVKKTKTEQITTFGVD